MKLVFPTKKYEIKAKAFIKEFIDQASPINGVGSLDKYLSEQNYDMWLNKIIKDIDLANIDNNRVPALTYFFIDDDDEIIGMINLRLSLNDFLKTEGGHIGYCIRPSKRNNHYGRMMLNEALNCYRRLNINEVIISCDKNNISSSKVILACNGVLDQEFYSDVFKTIVQRYIIKL